MCPHGGDVSPQVTRPHHHRHRLSTPPTCHHPNECDQNGTDTCYCPIYDAATDGEMRMIGTKIEGWVGSSPILAAQSIQASPGEARGIIA